MSASKVESDVTEQSGYRTRDKIFLIAAAVALMIIFPYVYYAGSVYNYIHANAEK